jgi:hypothetical protein
MRTAREYMEEEADDPERNEVLEVPGKGLLECPSLGVE